MKCPHCQRELPDKAAFCGYCGAKLPQACPNCGEVLEAGTQFCGHCGVRLEGVPGVEPVPTMAQETVISPAPPKVNAELMIESGPGSGRRFSVQDRMRLGRSTDNDIVLDDLKVSRHHAVIIIEGDRCFIQDQNSANGTFVNEERISQRELQSGDILRLGDTRLSFQRIGATMISPAPARPQAPAAPPSPAPPPPQARPLSPPPPAVGPLPAAAYPAAAPVGPERRSRRWSCVLVGLGLLVILIIICAVGIYTYPLIMKSLPLGLQTLTWKDYSNERSGFAARHPRNWNVQEVEGAIYLGENADDIQGGTFVAASQITDAFEKLEEEVGAPFADPKEALRAYARDQGLTDEPTNEFGDFVDITRGEYTGAMTQISNSETGRRTRIEVYQVGDKWWKLSGGAPLSQWEHYWPVLDAILDSVHFLSVGAEEPSSPQPTLTVGEETSVPTPAPQPTNTPSPAAKPTDIPPSTALPPSSDQFPLGTEGLSL